MFNSRVPNPGQVILIIAVMTACVFFTRLIPFVFFGGKRGMNPFIKKLSDILPLSMIAVLVVYCLKDTTTSGLSQNAVTAGSVAAVCGIHLWKQNTLLSIAPGTAVYMIGIRLI